MMPFGLKNAPATFMDLMNSIFFDVLDSFVVVYLDDILVYSNSLEEHSNHPRIVLGKLEKQGLVVNRRKCLFGASSIEYLGHIIGNGTISVDKKNVEAVNSWPSPQNVSQVKSFLGLINYFRKFIHKISIVTKPLTDLLQDNVEFI